MNYNKIDNYYDFVQFILRKLGAPVININVHDDQIIDRVSDAIQFYIEEHMDSTKLFHWLYKITEEDITRGYIQLSPDVIDVVDIKSRSSETNYDVDGLDDPEYQTMLGFWNGRVFSATGALMNYEITMQELRNIDKVLNSTVEYVWRSREAKLYLYKRFVADTVIMIAGYKILDPETDTSIWNSPWMKNYATALVGLQFATNLSKFGNVPSSGGITIDAQALLQRYTEEKEKLETEFMNKFQYPPLFYFE